MFPRTAIAGVGTRAVYRQSGVRDESGAGGDQPASDGVLPGEIGWKNVSRHCRRRVELRLPAFATYLMVLIPTPVHWHAAFNSGYFRVRPISHGDRVITVRESVIEELRAIEAEGRSTTKRRR